MIVAPLRSRQPLWEAWTHECLLHEQAIALGHTIDRSAQTCNSPLQSYLTFCKLHNFAIEPTTDTLSFYTVFMAHHINPRSVGAYLSGICSTLKPHFPTVRAIHNGPLVGKTLAGSKKLRGSHAPTQKQPLHQGDLDTLFTHYASWCYDDTLFLTLVTTGFSFLMRIGKFMQLNSLMRRSSMKTMLCPTCCLTEMAFSFTLPYHKGDQFFNGNTIMVERQPGARTCPHAIFTQYIFARDAHFPLHLELWLTLSGEIPTYSWVVSHMTLALRCDVSSHSICSGGAIALAVAGVPDHIIQLYFLFFIFLYHFSDRWA